MKSFATLIAATAIAATVPFAANADSYINSNPQFKSFGSSNSVNKQAKTDRSKRTVTVTPCKQKQALQLWEPGTRYKQRRLRPQWQGRRSLTTLEHPNPDLRSQVDAFSPSGVLTLGYLEQAACPSPPALFFFF